MAAAAVRIFHRAGVPKAALQLLPGRGETVGAALVADPRIAGVLFTGSTAVAGEIRRTLARRDDDPVLIAETGGMNAMIVDSSALVEQVVGDAIASAFDSAGQRCSALRVLCVQEEVADHALAMLKGAMRELRIGDPRALATDVGPVIDRDAQARLAQHVERQRAAGAAVFALPLPDACASGTYFAPTLIEIADLRPPHRGGLRPGAPRRALPTGRTAATRRGDQSHGLRPHARHPDADRRDDRPHRRHHPGGQHLCQSQHDRRGRRRAAVRRRGTVGHRPQGRRSALPAAARARGGDARSAAGYRPGRAARPDRRVEYAARAPARAHRVHRRRRRPTCSRRRGSRPGLAASRSCRRTPRASACATRLASAAKSRPIRSLRGPMPCCLRAMPPPRPRCGASSRTRKARSCRSSWPATAATTSSRLFVERTVTVNTTASGGNASLLSLEEAEPA